MFIVLNWRAVSYLTLTGKIIYIGEFFDQITALLESGQKWSRRPTLSTLLTAGGCPWTKGKIQQNKVTATKVWPRLVKRCRYVLYKHTTIFYATASYPVLTNMEIQAKMLLRQKTVRVPIFWTLNDKFKQIKCMKVDDSISVILITVVRVWADRSRGVEDPNVLR